MQRDAQLGSPSEESCVRQSSVSGWLESLDKLPGSLALSAAYACCHPQEEAGDPSQRSHPSSAFAIGGLKDGKRRSICLCYDAVVDSSASEAPCEG